MKRGAYLIGWLCSVAWLAGCQAQGPARVEFSGFRLLSDGSYLPAAQKPPPFGFYVVGQLTSTHAFFPITDVEGEGEWGEAGTGGWLELADGSIHATLPNAPPPTAPYVQGYVSLDGVFWPNSRRVIR